MNLKWYFESAKVCDLFSKVNTVFSCFVEHKNDKGRNMVKGRSSVEINCKQRIKKQIAIKLENLRGRMTAVQ